MDKITLLIVYNNFCYSAFYEIIFIGNVLTFTALRQNISMKA